MSFNLSLDSRGSPESHPKVPEVCHVCMTGSSASVNFLPSVLQIIGFTGSISLFRRFRPTLKSLQKQY